MTRLEAIILAGGSGSRFGGGKLLAPYRGAPLIEGALRAAMAAPVARSVLITGCDGDEVAETATILATREYPHQTLDVIHAEHHREGMAATLRAGIAALSPETGGAFVFLGDMPNIPLTVASRLSACIAGRSASAPSFQGKRGHPVLFAARLFPELLQMRGDRGARSILGSLGDDLALMNVDDAGVLFDVDYRSDLVP